MRTDTDEQLASRAIDGDVDALGAILERHLHPAWRIALAAAGAVEPAAAAVEIGVCDAVLATGRHPDPTRSLRTRIVAAVHHAVLEADRSTRLSSGPTDDPVLAAFATLPVASRSALWLAEVEGGAPEQLAPVLGLDRSSAAALVDRATTALRDRLATDAASHAEDPDCTAALRKLAVQSRGKATEAERQAISDHLAACGACAAVLAAIVAPRPALRRMVTPVPAKLPLAIAERWAEHTHRDGVPWLRGWGERAVGAAAAAVLAVGLAGVALFGRDDETGPELAAPAELVGGGGTPPAGSGLPDPVLSTAGSTPTTGATGTLGSIGGGSGSGGGGGTSGTTTTTLGDLPRGDGGPTPTTPTTGSPTPTTPTTGSPTPTTPTTSVSPDGGDPPASSTDDGTQATIELPGGVVVGIGDETGVGVGGTEIGDAPDSSGEPTVDVDLPGLPSIGAF